MEFEGISMNNNISYKIISPNQKVENDKERIKSKFNFNISRTSTNSSVLKQSSLPTQQNSIIKNKNNNKSKIKDKILQQNEKKLNINHYRPKSNINIKNNNINNAKTNKQSKLSQTKQKGNRNSKNESNMSINYMMKKKKISNATHNNNNSNFSGKKNNNYTQGNNIIDSITYKNYNTFLNDNSITVGDNQSILKGQVLIDGINNYNSKYNNNYIDTNNKIENYFKIENENDNSVTLPEVEISGSLNKSSFSGSSKTSEIVGDIVIKNSSAGEGNIQIVNNDNYVIKNFNGINKNDHDNNEKEENLPMINMGIGMENSERKKTEVNTMGLLDDDEYNQENRKKMLNNISTYYFIEDIIKKNDNFISLSFDKFKNLNNKGKYKIFSFIYDHYKILVNSSKLMRNIIRKMLEEKFTPCIDDFKNKFKNILSVESYKFNLHEFIKTKLKKKKFQTFCLYIKARVLPNNEYFLKFGDICFELSYKYKVRSMKNDYNSKSTRTNVSSQSYESKDHIQEEYMQIYKFDLRKDKNYPMWICSERDEIFNYTPHSLGGINNLISRVLLKDELYQKHLIYSTPVINVNENDYLVFRFDLIENNNVIENISFNEPIVQSVNKKYYHKLAFKQKQRYDKMRDCENEVVVNCWHDDYVISKFKKDDINYEEFLNRLKKTFQDYFEIIETKFDISKFVFIRMTMKAKKLGILKSNIFSNKDIEIVDKNASLTKECTPINFVNTFSMNKSLTIKQGTIVDLYLME